MSASFSRTPPWSIQQDQRARRIVEETRLVKEYIKTQCRFLTHNNTIVERLDGRNDRARELFLEGLLVEAGRIARSSISAIEDVKKRFNFGKRDINSYSDYLINSRVGGADPSTLTEKVKRFLNEEEKARTNTFRKLLSPYTPFVPHAFCFVPDSDVFQIPIEDLLSQALNKKNYELKRGWHTGPRIRLYSNEDLGHFANVTLKFLAEKPLLKVKLYAKCPFEPTLKDAELLDVEWYLRNGKGGLAHFHVSKPHTVSKTVSYPVVDSGIELSISHRTDEFSITPSETYRSKGDLVWKTGGEFAQYVGPINFWREHPVFFGGALLENVVKYLKSDRRFDTLAHAFTYRR